MSDANSSAVIELEGGASPLSLLPLPSPAQMAWQKTETNLFFHFGINTFTGREWGDGKEDPAIFNPTRLDCRQWAKVAKAGGFRIGILTAKHHDGFCLWPTRTTDHSVKNSPWREGCGDVVREFVDAFRAEGLRVGLYLSPWDRHEPTYGDSDRYNDIYCRQLTELLSEYGELDEVWFDGACAEGPNGRVQIYDWERFFEIVRELQPGAVTFGDGGTDVRWVGNERGIAGETCWSSVNPNSVRFPGDSGISQANDAKAKGEFESLLNSGEMPDGNSPRVWRPVECDVSIRPGWFYRPEENDKVRSTENLVDLYFHSVGRNGLLLLNLPITPEGLVHDIDAVRVEAFRAALDNLFCHDLAENAFSRADSFSPEHPVTFLTDGDPESFWAAGDSHIKATIDLEFSEPQSVGVIELREPIAMGQRISKHRIDVEGPDGVWREVYRGTTIGYKKLHRIRCGPTRCMRLVVENSLATPALCRLSLYASY